MMVKSDRWIKRMAQEKKMIEPFADRQVREGVISFGVSSYGYDMRVADEFKVFEPPEGGLIDPKKFDPDHFTPVKGAFVDIPPNAYVLARSVEYFRIPRDILTITFGKSTYARCGVIVNVTPFEPEWEGFVTIAINNANKYPARIYSNEGIAQVVFLGAEELCEISYADKKGKYQAQQSITHAKL
ncbi:MAG: dCTP deaminase [Candidatus Sumerlaeota bacterium]|nr:dCTP deaminase [Candidatus Sumerlaeota bacterium]